MQPSGSTRVLLPPVGVFVHTTAPGSREGRSVYTGPGYVGVFFRPRRPFPFPFPSLGGAAPGPPLLKRRRG
ncbi:hypothetical protein SHKM778_29830 [Streptomyces sp. KM77-8]|uniref:Uncharacterized protein n=1 Tax=Streptomyces haneummycinicus TaxID=3074435 RepID=A0AAT9HGR1_9ACTN